MSFKRKKINGGLARVEKRVSHPGIVDIGIIDAGDHDSGDYTVAQIGLTHEFGAGPVPERSFMRTTLSEQRKEILRIQRKLLRKMVSGKITQNQALGLLGDWVRGKIREKIVDIRTPANSPETLKRKAPKTNPLVDTGQLENSITFKVG